MALIHNLQFPSSLTVSASTAEQNALSIDALMIFDPATHRYQGAKATFSSMTTSVRSTSIKTTPIHRMLTEQLRIALGVDPTNADLAAKNPCLDIYFRGVSRRKLAAQSIKAPSATLLDQAAAVHAAARAIGDYPVLAVARSCGLTHREANRWVGRLRRAEELLV